MSKPLLPPMLEAFIAKINYALLWALIEQEQLKPSYCTIALEDAVLHSQADFEAMLLKLIHLCHEQKGRSREQRLVFGERASQSLLIQINVVLDENPHIHCEYERKKSGGFRPTGTAVDFKYSFSIS